MQDNLKTLKILLVEDSKIVIIVHSEMIKRVNQTLDIAETGKAALSLAKETDYDLIFMDIGLPDMKGTEVTEKIRALKKLNNHKTTIIGLTAYKLEEVQAECLAAGMDSVINKPATQETLKQTIDACSEKLYELSIGSAGLEESSRGITDKIEPAEAKKEFTIALKDLKNNISQLKNLNFKFIETINECEVSYQKLYQNQ